MTHSKKCKKCHKKRNRCTKLEVTKIKADKIEANIIEANEIRANKIILDGFPLSHPPIITQGFHDASLVVEGNSKNINNTVPFPSGGVFSHPVAYNPDQVFLVNDIQSDTTFSELKGWKVDILYSPVLINNSDKNIGMSCIMFLELKGQIDTPDTTVSFSGTPPYPGDERGYEHGSLIGGIQDQVLFFNEVTKKQRKIAGQSGVSELIFIGEIQNMFMGRYGYYNERFNIIVTSDVWYDPETKKFLYFNDEMNELDEIGFNYSSKVGLVNVVMQLTLDDHNDAQFLEIVVGDTGPHNLDHKITIQPSSFPEPR